MVNDCTRIFLVGCGRSGTTLLQAMLSAHGEIVSFPESQFFSDLIDQYESRVMGADLSQKIRVLYAYQSLLLSFGIAPRPASGISAINRFIDKTNIESEHIKLDFRRHFISCQISEMTGLLDLAARCESKKAWLLKTPSNIAYIDIIEKYVDSARFIHIVRPGKDVVASIYDAALNFPDTVWNTHFYRNSLERMANMWNASVSQTIRYVQKPSHIAVLYESLLENPAGELSRLFDFVGVENDPSCGTRYSDQTTNIVSGNERWKGRVSGSVESVDKYETIFDATQKALLESILDNVDFQSIVSL